MFHNVSFSIISSCLFLISTQVYSSDRITSNQGEPIGTGEIRFIAPEDDIDQIVEYLDYGDYGLIEGDIYVNKQASVSTSITNDSSIAGPVVSHGAVPIHLSSRWPDGIVRYTIDSSAITATTVIYQAIAHIEAVTNVRFIQVPAPEPCSGWGCPNPYPEGYVNFFSGQGCYSLIGYQGGRKQNISLGRGCKVLGVVLHEILHTLGLYHEHSRSDRDNYVTVHYENIPSHIVPQFRKQLASQTLNIGPYDFSSIMHYGNKAFSSNGLQTMTSLTGEILRDPGYKNALSSVDIDTLNAMYPAPSDSNYLETLMISNVSANWSNIAMSNVYTDPVVVCSVVYSNNTIPVVTRLRNVGPTGFDVRLQNPGDGSTVVGDDVHCLVIESGNWKLPDGRLIEAQHYTSTITDYKPNWQGESQAYLNTYIAPVVLGQVMSANDAKWSSFWSRGPSRSSAPNTTTIITGKHIGEDSALTRTNEEIGLIVIESGSGNINGLNYEAGLGTDSIKGLNVSNTPYNFTQAFLNAPQIAVVSLSGMDGGDGGWSVLHNTDSLTPSTIKVGIDEDQISNTERGHTTEQVGYFAIDFSGSILLEPAN